VEEPEVISGIDYKSSLLVFCYKIPKPQIKNNTLHNLYIGFMCTIFTFHFEKLQLNLKNLIHNSQPPLM